MPVRLEAVQPADAIATLEARGRKLDPSFAWQERYADDHARAFTVAKSTGFDILGDIYAGLEAALKEGKTARQFAAELTPLLQAKGWWGRQNVVNPDGELENVQLGSPRRLRTIFDVNMRVSYAAGHWASFERNRASRPFLRYVAIMDEATRPSHALNHNVCLPIDHPHWRTWSPPCGWACRCTLQSLSQRDVDRMKGELKLEPPTIPAFPWENRVTGEVRFIPDGIDPGWDYNPGREGYRGAVNAAFATKAGNAPRELLDAAIEASMRSPEFARFIQAPEGFMPIGALPELLAAPIGAGERVRGVALSAETMRKQLANHRELTGADYRLLPQVIGEPTIVLHDVERTLVFLKEVDGRWWYAVAKSTSSGAGLFLTSYRALSVERIERRLGRAGTKILLDRRG